MITLVWSLCIAVLCISTATHLSRRDDPPNEVIGWLTFTFIAAMVVVIASTGAVLARWIP